MTDNNSPLPDTRATKQSVEALNMAIDFLTSIYNSPRFASRCWIHESSAAKIPTLLQQFGTVMHHLQLGESLLERLERYRTDLDKANSETFRLRQRMTEMGEEIRNLKHNAPTCAACSQPHAYKVIEIENFKAFHTLTETMNQIAMFLRANYGEEIVGGQHRGLSDADVVVRYLAREREYHRMSAEKTDKGEGVKVKAATTRKRKPATTATQKQKG